MAHPPRWRRVIALTAVSATVLSSIALAALPATADTAPAAGTPSTVAADSLPAPQTNGVVWTQVVVGDTDYVGGNFTQAQPAGAAAGASTTGRAGMLAYTLSTGALVTGFAPTFNAQVRGLAASPDGSTVYAVGDFTTVNGTSHSRIVALDASTGAVRPGFTASANASVLAVTTSGSTVYFGGSFTSVNGTARTRAAAVSGTSGSLTAFAPVLPDYSVRALVVSPDGAKVVLGGSFTGLNGSTSPGQGLGAVDAATGVQNRPWAVGNLIYNHGKNSAIWSLSSDGTNVYGTGYVYGGQVDGNLEGSFNARWSDGAVNWIEDCHGDTYSVAALGDTVYTVSHAHYCGNLPNGFAQTDPNPSTALKQHALAFSKAATGTLAHDPYGPPYVDLYGQPAPTLLSWYPTLGIGSFTGQSQAAWNVVTSANGYLLLGGEFPTVNGQRQVGLARFAVKSIAPDKEGPQLSGSAWTPSAVSLGAGSMRVSWPANWDRDNADLTYTISRGGKVVHTETAESESFWLRPTLGFTDTGLSPGTSVKYTVTATDPFGNSATSAATTSTVSSGTAASAYANDVLADGASHYWRLGEAGGPAVYDWAGYDDLTAGSGVTFGSAGALRNDANTAAMFSGTATGLAATRTAVPGPDTFSIETWFKTSSTTGGKLVGFGNADSGNSSSYDRHVYMDGSGSVYFGVYPGTTRTVQSAPGYNDGSWHQVVASLSAAGMQLFLDGKKVASRTDTTSGQPYAGYWRIGGDSTWAGADYFSGSIDDTAIYPVALAASTIKAHYADAGYGTQVAAPTDLYGKQVFSDGPDAFWRLGDRAGSTSVADASGNGAGATANGGVAFGAAGGVAGALDGAAAFDGASGVVVADRAQVDPEVYSLQLWFDTTTTSGGKLIGFGDARTGESSNYDRQVWMRDDGRLAFGVYPGSEHVVTSSGAYNDGRWHQVVATQGADGLRLYVDGALVGTDPTSTAQAYTGYWRLGGDHVWGGSSSDFFAGTLDDVAIYGNALTAGQIANAYQIGSTATSTNAPPVAAYTASASDLKVAFDGSGSADHDGSIVSYVWDFGDGSAPEHDVTASTSHTYAKAGTYTVVLTVTDDDGSINTTSKQVTVAAANRPPAASFTAAPSGLGVALDASASNDPDGSIVRYAWSFGDGTATETGTAPQTAHSYGAAGDYTVSLTVTDDQGATATTAHHVTVSAPNRAPTASFTASVSDLEVAVDGTASTDPDGSVASYAWNFGDGGTAGGSSARHAYSAGGTFTVTLTVTDDGGASTSTTRSITVAAASSATIASDAFARTVSGGLGTADRGGPWALSGTASDFSVAPGAAQLATAPGSTRSAYLSGATATSSDVSATVSLPGLPVGGTSYTGVVGRRVGSDDYNARILVASNGAVTVQVMHGTSALKSATVSGLTYVAGLPLRLRLQTIGSSPTTVQARVWKASAAEPTAWQVSATDTTAGLQASGAVGVRSYLGSAVTSGKTAFSFSAFAAQTAGASAPAEPAPPANAAPTAAFTAAQTGLSLSVDASASTDSDGSIAAYSWDFGDGATGTGRTASHTYAAGGTYGVVLTTTDDRGAKGTVSKQVTLTAPAASPAHLAADAFERAVTAGLGAADTGGSWTIGSATTSYSVASGAGALRTAAGSTLSAYLSSVSSAASDVSAAFTVPALPAGGTVYAGVVGRRVGTDDYNARVLVAAGGGVSVQILHGGTALKTTALTGVTAAAGSVVHLRLRTTGAGNTSLQARAWLDGGSEPTSWQASSTDTTSALQTPGSVGIRTYLGGGVTNGPIVLRVDDFLADPAD